MSLQTFVDAREDLNIRAYEIWQGWAQEHALREIERQLRGEGVEGAVQKDRLSPFALVVWLLSTTMVSIGIYLVWKVSVSGA